MATSKMFEGYCGDIERLLRETSVRGALRLSVALPDICAALENPAMTAGAQAYGSWFAQWVVLDPNMARKPIDGARLHRVHARFLRRAAAPSSPRALATPLLWLRMRRSARTSRGLTRARLVPPSGRLLAFQTRLCERLLRAARRWYVERGATDPIVQRNLGTLALTR